MLGEVFEGRRLKDLIIEAIRRDRLAPSQGEAPRDLDAALDLERFRAILQREALCEEVITPEKLRGIKEEMERAEARKMQPHQVAAFFLEAFRELGGRCQEVEPRRYELRWVPAEVCARGRALGAAENRSREVVVSRYERVCFEKELVRLHGKPQAAFLHPGHPLLKAVLALVLEKHAAAFRQGAVLVDPEDWSAEPRLLFLLDHTVQEGGSGRTLSRLVQFVKIDREGRAVDAAWAPHLDLRPVEAEERALVAGLLRGGLAERRPGAARPGVRHGEDRAGALPAGAGKPRAGGGQAARRGARAADPGDHLVGRAHGGVARRGGGRQGAGREPGERAAHR